MQENKKSKNGRGNVAIIIAAVCCYVLGIGSIVFAVAGEKWEISRVWQIALTIIGVVALLLFVFAIYRYLTRYIAAHKEWEIEEKDERNEMIRGKASVQCTFIMSFLLLAADVILIVSRQWLAVAVLCALNLIEVTLHAILFAYYEKQY